MMSLKQSGVALITVMLILALATVTAVSMASKQNIDTHRSANILNYEQAYQYISGAEDFSKQKLIIHFANNIAEPVTEVDINKWKVAFPVEGGSISGEIEDLQALFNVNSLVDANGVANQLQITRFRNLLSNIPLTPPANLTINTNIVEAIVDWIDRDQNPLGVNGVEDNEYLGYTESYRTANQPMSDISELLLIKGIDKNIYDILLKYLCVLKEVNSAINVNTASAVVISSLDSNITLNQADTLVANRVANSFASVADFLNDPIFAGLNISVSGLSVTSDYFRLKTLAQINKTNLRYTSQLYRNANRIIRVIKRSRSVL